jgi:hypothetical protein
MIRFSLHDWCAGGWVLDYDACFYRLKRLVCKGLMLFVGF